MTRSPYTFEGESMSDEMEQAGTLVDERELWSVQLQAEDGTPWFELGTPNADAATILRIHDYRKEHFPDEKVRIARTVVKVTVEDPEQIRKSLQQDTAENGS